MRLRCTNGGAGSGGTHGRPRLSRLVMVEARWVCAPSTGSDCVHRFHTACALLRSADLFAAEEKDEIITACRAATKAAGLVDTNANVWRFFIQRVCRRSGWLTCRRLAQPACCAVSRLSSTHQP